MRIHVIIVMLLAAAACTSPQQRKDGVLALKEMSDLATVEYTVSKIVRASDDQTWYKVGDRKILMSCKATLRAGIDFSAIDPSSVDIKGDEVTIILPHAKLLSVNIRPEDVKLEYEELGLLRSAFTASERDAIMAQGEAQIKAGVNETGILNTAESNAGLFVSNFLRQLGYKTIHVQFADHANPSTLR